MIDIKHNIKQVHVEWAKIRGRIDRNLGGAIRQYAEEVASQVQEDIGFGGYTRKRIGERTWQINNRPEAKAPNVYRRTGELAGSITAKAERLRGLWIGKVGTPKKVGLYLWKGTRGGGGHGKSIPLEVITGKPEKNKAGKDKWVRIKRRGAIKARPYFETAAKKKEKRGEVLIDRAVRKALRDFKSAQ